MKGIIAKKLGMTQIFGEDGTATPVTVLEATPNPVVAKSGGDDGAPVAVQLAADPVAPRKLSKAEVGHLAKSKVEPHRILQTFAGLETDVEVGDAVNVEQFADGDSIKVTGTSIGKGFQGTIKRHNFGRGPMSHGSHNKRAPGSIGASAWPARVMKGQAMPGRMGGDTVTQRGLTVVRVDAERNLLLVRGSVPGAKNSYVTVVSD